MHRSQDPGCSATPCLPEAIKRSAPAPSDLGHLAQQHPAGLQEDALPSLPPSGSAFEPGLWSVPTQMGHTRSSN